MTLLTTEIHNPEDPKLAFIIFAADRRITIGTKRKCSAKKIFRIPKLRAGIGYFGIAEVSIRGKRLPMSTWLQDFVRSTGKYESLMSFASELTESLNVAVPSTWRRKWPSGFHIAGFDSSGRPEFWYVRNVDDDRTTLFSEYRLREDFQSQDAQRLPPQEYQSYRNGDIRVYVSAWEKLDLALGLFLTGVPDFKPLQSPSDYLKWVKFKMELLARFYEGFCLRSIIGRPIDAFVVIPSHK